MDCISPEGHKLKMKESWKFDKYLTLGWELNILWRIKVKVILIVDSLHWTVSKNIEKNRISEEEIRLSKQQHCQNRLRYFGGLRRKATMTITTNNNLKYSFNLQHLEIENEKRVGGNSTSDTRDFWPGYEMLEKYTKKFTSTSW